MCAPAKQADESGAQNSDLDADGQEVDILVDDLEIADWRLVLLRYIYLSQRASSHHEGI